MPTRTVYEAKIEHLQILDEEGNLDKKLAKGTLTDAQVVHLYEQMRICRELDEIAFKLQRSGRMGTYPQNKGQEANAVGSALAMKKGTDWLVSAYRENAALFMHGLPMHYVLVYWMGDERGSKMPEGVNITPLSVPIGTHMLHAAGIAWAAKIRKEKDKAVITYFGDGATSEGDFHGAMNFASTLQVPLVFYCQNNQWAISVPRERQMRSETVAQKALAYGMPTIRVDGNDIFAVYKATKDARARAIKGGGPTFIEGLTYRLGDHTTADDARRYRDPKEVEAWVQKDPLIRTRLYLESVGKWDDKKQKTLEARAEKITAEVVRAAEGIEPPVASDMFDSMYAELPASLVTQRNTMRTSSIGQNPEQAGLRANPTAAERV
ncbi:MAG: pyruvate dehydrogenase (acetyl-transferring) E1 component subunit alpha [Phycisphaeraceae bacterium]|nr:MAG: pyruvate dehydrogenase (acetyl-transferring) E1 component subunit alpha [Phycisphaeraceae bacterium]